MRMPRKRIPKNGGTFDAELTERRPENGRRRLAPRPQPCRQSRAVVCDPRNVTADQQSLAGERNPSDAAPLIAWRLADQQVCRLHAHMRHQPLTASARTILLAVIRTASGPGIEYLRAAVMLQESNEPCDVGAHGLEAG